MIYKPDGTIDREAHRHEDPGPDIHFTWNGVNYVVGGEAYGVKPYIILPDKTTILKVCGWFEMCPPYPRSIKEVFVTVKDEDLVVAREDLETPVKKPQSNHQSQGKKGEKNGRHG